MRNEIMTVTENALLRLTLQKAGERGLIMKWHRGDDGVLHVSVPSPIVAKAALVQTLEIQPEAIEGFLVGLTIGLG